MPAAEKTIEMWSFSHLSSPNSIITEFSGFAAVWSDISNVNGVFGFSWKPTSNLKLEGAFFPYKKNENLSHYQVTQAVYTPASTENNSMPFHVNLGMHRLINRNSATSRWYNLGINYDFNYRNFQFSSMWFNLFAQNESIHLFGISIIKRIIPEFIPAVSLFFDPAENKFRIQMLLSCNP